MASKFNENMNNIKIKTLEWIKGMHRWDDDALTKIEAELQRLEQPEGGGYLTRYIKLQLIQLEMEKRRILEAKEEMWRLKSRAT